MPNTRQTPHPQHAPPQHHSREDPLSEAVQHLAQLAPTLKEAELRTLLYLTAEALAHNSTSIRASSREIAKTARVARSSVVEALDDLTDRGVIATRQGTSTSAATYLLRFLEVTTMGGPVAGPPPRTGGPTAGPQVDLLPDHPGPIAGPPPTDSEELPAAPSSLDINPQSIEVLDRVFSAEPKTFDRGELGKVRQLIAWTAEKHGRPYHQDPDFRVCAQIFEACNRNQKLLEWLVIEMHTSRQNPGASPSWWVTVALQRLQGIDYKTTKARRDELKAEKRPRLVDRATPAIAPAPPPEAEPARDEQSVADLKQQIAAVAARKRL
jgi:DNA-binding MarR family transcriptional regulator